MELKNVRKVIDERELEHHRPYVIDPGCFILMSPLYVPPTRYPPAQYR